MHGRPRKALSTEEQEASAIKASKLRDLQSEFLHFHQNKIYTEEALDLNAQLLEANPEYLTAWNYRKLAVQHNLSHSNGEETVKSVLDPELRLVEIALRKNPKSYGAWYHRKWVLSKGHLSTDRELRLLREFQKLDARNFHAWNYRRFVTELRNISHEEELEYTTNMIYDNFSNYSAWHNRSVLLSHLMQKKVQEYSPKNVLSEEFEFVRHALFTDPDDQSGWFYHLWLLDQTVKSDMPHLVSSWPPYGSDLFLSFDGSMDGRALSSFTVQLLNDGRFPLVLYFNEVVKGVNSSTVTVETEFDVNCDLVWKPLSTNNPCYAQAWVALLKVPHQIVNLSKVYLVKVSLGHSQGISSLNGLQCSNSCCIEFKISVQSSEKAKGSHLGRISWTDESFYECDAQFHEPSPVSLFHGLRISKNDEPATSDWKAKIIDDEIAHCRELLSTMDCKIGKLSLARLLVARDDLVSSNHSTVSALHSEETLELLHDLMKLDPMHAQYYKDKHSVAILNKVISRLELFRYVRQYKDSTASEVNKFVCLRLCNLLLSRIGSVEKLLWVQMLDLSNNRLQSIEGLEALQLLHSLNLSSNKLESFLALEPLRLLKSLKRLNISYNEIGAHSIDTRRYLCSSPLSHSVIDWNTEKSAISEPLSCYWEAYLIFRDMNLMQLDIEGNAVADESFKLFIVKLLSVLRWLDGEELH